LFWGAIDKLKKGLEKSRNSVFEKVKSIFLDDDANKELYLEKLEEILILSDIGQSLTQTIIKNLEFQNEIEYSNLIEKIKEILTNLLINSRSQGTINSELNVTILVGVNGVGKT